MFNHCFSFIFRRIYWFYMQIRKQTEPNETCYTLTQTFRYLNCCCNFFLYSATSSLFRRELREIFQCLSSSKSNSRPTSIVRRKQKDSPKNQKKSNVLVTFNPVTSVAKSVVANNQLVDLTDGDRPVCQN